jgi:cytoskeletal protein CcmA (bactofilin family)/DNA-directed RNA polymerase subunit RPC12/RpoP
MKKEKVACPHCGHEQDEAPGVISTNCRNCGKYFPVQLARKKQAVRMPKTSRSIICFQCGSEHKVIPDALSTQCPECSTYLNLKNYDLSGACKEIIHTYGTVRFQPGCHYRGPEVRAKSVEISGRVEAHISAETHIILKKEVRVGGRLSAPDLQVETRTQANVGRLRIGTLQVSGILESEEVHAARSIFIKPGGVLIAKKILAPELHVEEGGGCHGAFVTTLPPAE